MSLLDDMRHSTPEELEAYRRMKARTGETLVPESEVAELKAENAKLRELCAELLRNAQVAANVGVNVGKLTVWERRAVELGVEVD